MNQQSNRYDVIIIGAGPAGMTAAVYASRAELKVLLLDYQMPGGKLILTNEVENYPGDTMITGQALAQRMFEHSVAFGAEHRTDQITGIRQHDGLHEVIGTEGTYVAPAVIVASGTVERKLNIPGEAEYYGMGVSYCAVCDGAFFKGKETVVIGGGNTAFEDALYLTKFASHVDLIMRRDVSRAEKYLQKRVAESAKITIRHFYNPLEICGDGSHVTSVRLKQNQTGEELLLDTAAVFPMVGLDANTAFLKGLPVLDKAGFILAEDDMSTAIPGLFAAGDVCQKGLRQIVTATSDGAVAAQSVTHYLDNLDSVH
ncbi:thioredoxin-disulfide reductase [Oscillospiraceae bacterium HV4-5-C5C]|nr:thioredoxin-disulfide reductase [Oscillospiraceae bacterium HV4-5-C5C]